MKAYVLDAFSDRLFGGNPAGAALVDSFPPEGLMRAVAAEFRHSETVFIRPEADGSFTLRYFTPAGEVALCGHATIAAFSLLFGLGRIGNGSFIANTGSGRLTVDVNSGTVWTDMASPAPVEPVRAEDVRALAAAFGLDAGSLSDTLEPVIASCGLRDVLLPVKDRAALLRAVQNEKAVSELSERLRCTGVHMFCPGDGGHTAYCSNFAPLVGIPEECATGTSNAALTYYLFTKGLVVPGEENSFLQGEHMGRPSVIKSVILPDKESLRVRIGGRAVMSMECDIKLN